MDIESNKLLNKYTTGRLER